MTADELCALIARHRFSYSDEGQLQAGLQSLLESESIPFEREKILGPSSRPDFFIEGIAVEAKIKHGLADLTRQIHRYASFDIVKSIVVVTTRMRLSNLPDTVLGKPVFVVTLLGAFM